MHSADASQMQQICPSRHEPVITGTTIPVPFPSLTPRFAATPSSGSHRKIAIVVDLSNESAFTVRRAVQNYLRHGDSVILLHVRPTSFLYGADWGSVDPNQTSSEESKQKLEDEFDNFTASKATDVAKPLVEAKIPFRIHIVKDHDMKERLCLEVERKLLWQIVALASIQKLE